jgi:hypothetical protein
MSMCVRVVIGGIYNGPGHRALPWAEPGALIEVADAEYGARLLAEGRVAEVTTRTEPGPGEMQVGAGPLARKRAR